MPDLPLLLLHRGLWELRGHNLRSRGNSCYYTVDLIRLKLKSMIALMYSLYMVLVECLVPSFAWLMGPNRGGIGFDEGLGMFDHEIQSYSVLVAFIWTLLFTYIILKVISMFTNLGLTSNKKLMASTRLYMASGYNK